MIQCVHPKSGRTGRGAPCTFGFLIRAATAPRRALWATTTTNGEDRTTREAPRDARPDLPPAGRRGGGRSWWRLSRGSQELGRHRSDLPEAPDQV